MHICLPAYFGGGRDGTAGEQGATDRALNGAAAALPDKARRLKS